MNARPAIFLDKDGTLIPDLPYNVQPQLIGLSPGAATALPLLVEAGFELVVISNQSGVARGFFEEAALIAVENRIRDLLEQAGVSLAGFYYCPHHPEGAIAQYARNCKCRKPQPGLFHRAAAELGLSLEDSWMIGDILNDVEAAHRAGCRAALLLNGGESVWELSDVRIPEVFARDLTSAVRKILRFTSLGRQSAGAERRESPDATSAAATTHSASRRRHATFDTPCNDLPRKVFS